MKRPIKKFDFDKALFDAVFAQVQIGGEKSSSHEAVDVYELIEAIRSADELF